MLHLSATLGPLCIRFDMRPGITVGSAVGAYCGPLTGSGRPHAVSYTHLILPYLLLPASAWLASLGILLATVVLIIAGFTYYVSVAQGLSFRHRFCEMAFISLGVAVISFVIGLLVKQFLGIDL